MKWNAVGVAPHYRQAELFHRAARLNDLKAERFSRPNSPPAIDHSKRPHEAAYLKPNCEKARTRLDWLPVIDFDIALKLSSRWYRAFHRVPTCARRPLQQ